MDTIYMSAIADTVATSPVYDAYWSFAAERQRVFTSRLANRPPPWTTDPILSQYRFTNVYRIADRVSQYLVRSIIYDDYRRLASAPSAYASDDPDEMVFRILLFKLFNKIETWEHLRDALGTISWRRFDINRYSAILEQRAAIGPIFSAAYIMPSGVSAFGSRRKHINILRLLAMMMRDGLPRKVVGSRSLRELYELLRSYPMIGSFLAYQFAIDLNYSPLINHSEGEFVVAGPGAIRGIAKCFRQRSGYDDADLIRRTCARQRVEFARRGLEFEPLGGRPLQLVDCQNLFCEIDKYARVAYPDVAATPGDRQRNRRIKQRYRPSAKPVELFLPPKWQQQPLPS